jgi:hypothetical protein
MRNKRGRVICGTITSTPGRAAAVANAKRTEEHSLFGKNAVHEIAISNPTNLCLIWKNFVCGCHHLFDMHLKIETFENTSLKKNNAGRKTFRWQPEKYDGKANSNKPFQDIKIV